MSNSFVNIITILFPHATVALAFLGSFLMFLKAISTTEHEEKSLSLVLGIISLAFGILDFYAFSIDPASDKPDDIVFIVFLGIVFIISVLANNYLTTEKWNYLDNFKLKFTLSFGAFFCFLSLMILLYWV